MHIPVRALLLFSTVFLFACAPARINVVRGPATLPVEIAGLNILVIHGLLIDPSRAASGVTVQELASPYSEHGDMRDELVAELPRLFAEKGIRAVATSVNPIPGVAAPTRQDQFGESAKSNHLLVITPQRAVTSCYQNICKTAYTVKMSLKAPGDESELAQVFIAEEETDVRRNRTALMEAIVKTILSWTSKPQPG